MMFLMSAYCALALWRPHRVAPAARRHGYLRYAAPLHCALALWRPHWVAPTARLRVYLRYAAHTCAIRQK